MFVLIRRMENSDLMGLSLKFQVAVIVSFVNHVRTGVLSLLQSSYLRQYIIIILPIVLLKMNSNLLVVKLNVLSWIFGFI